MHILSANYCMYVAWYVVLGFRFYYAFELCYSTAVSDHFLSILDSLHMILKRQMVHNVPYSWKFLRDKNFKVYEDFDVSSKIKPSKFGFKMIIICEKSLYLKNLFAKSWKEAIIENFQPYGIPCKRNFLMGRKATNL